MIVGLSFVNSLVLLCAGFALVLFYPSSRVLLHLNFFEPSSLVLLYGIFDGDDDGESFSLVVEAGSETD